MHGLITCFSIGKSGRSQAGQIPRKGFQEAGDQGGVQEDYQGYGSNIHASTARLQ